MILATLQGTASPQATELQEVYQLPVMTIPPNAPSCRTDHGPKMFFAKEQLEEPVPGRDYVGPIHRDEKGRGYKTGLFFWLHDDMSGPRRWCCMLEHTKYGQLVSDIHKSYQTGQPVLVGTSTVQESIEIYDRLLTCRDGPRQEKLAFHPKHVRILNATPELAAKEASIIAEVQSEYHPK